MMNNFPISASNIHKSFGEIHAVDGVSLEVKAREIYGLVGADGAGKTTTMRLLVGALKADSGNVTICGFNVAKEVENARAQIGYLSQRFSMYEDLTVLENIRFFAEVRGLKSGEWLPRCLEILEFVGLDKFVDRRAGQLSGGMKQKLGLASALVTRPRLLLLDEPTTGVDPVTRQDFWQLLIRLVSAKDNQVAVLVSTPYMDEASRCHRVSFMKDGKIVAEDTPSNLRARLNGRILELRGSPIGLLRQVARKEEGVEDVQAFGDKLHIRVGEGKAQDVLVRLKIRIGSEGGEVDVLRAVPSTLEDVFIALSESESMSLRIISDGPGTTVDQRWEMRPPGDSHE